VGKGFAGITNHKNAFGSLMVVSTALWYLHYSQSAKTQKERWIALGFMFLSWGGDKEVYEIDCIRVAARIPC
jgi:hypothetical protein